MRIKDYSANDGKKPEKSLPVHLDPGRRLVYARWLVRGRPGENMITLPSNPTTRVGINVAILLASVVALRLGQSIFIPTIIALLLGAVLGPGALWLHRRLNFPWMLSCITAVSGLVLLNLLVTVVLAISVSRMLAILPRAPEGAVDATGEKKDQQQIIYERIVKKIKDLAWWDFSPDVFPERAEDSPVFLYIRDTVQKSVPEALIQIGLYGTNWFWQWILILFILFFLLLEGGMLTRRVVEIFGPSIEVQNEARKVLSDMAGQVKTYLVWRTIINFGLAIVVGTFFSIAGLHSPWTWALLLAILNYIPYLGPVLAAIPPLFDALLTISPLGAVMILVMYTVVIIVEGYLIVPLLMGRSMDLNATTVLLACLFWDLVWGTLGLFLAMPLMAAMKAICYHVPGWRPWANLMSTGEGEPHPVILPSPTGVEAIADHGQKAIPEINPEPSMTSLLVNRRGLVGFTLGALVTCTVIWMLIFVFQR
jgi:predicted PurR-regulated permease PerM